MSQTHFQSFLIIWCFLGGGGLANRNAICKTTSSTTYAIEWPSTSTSTISSPPCVDPSKEFLFRDCNAGTWDLEPSCDYVQPQTLPQCPHGFTDSISFCYILTSKTTFPPRCPFTNILPFDSYVDLVNTSGTPIWIPVRRDLSNGLGFMQWIEPSSRYRTEFDETYFLDDIIGKDCLVYYNSTYIVLVSCEEEYSGVCAYEKLDEISSQSCNAPGLMCRQSDFDPASTCFCLGGEGLNQSEYTKVEFLKLYQNKIYEILTSDPCTIGLERAPNNAYIWVSSEKEIDYCYWSTDTFFDESHKYGASTRTGWILTESPLPCFLFEKKPDIPEPSLDLTVEENQTGMNFLLYVNNPKGLKELASGVSVYCFTNSGPLNLIYRYEIISLKSQSDSTVVYEFEPYKYGPGDYWCEAFKYSTSELIKSQSIFVNETQRFGTEFVAILQIQYVKGTNPLSVSIFDLLARIFYIKLSASDEVQFTYTSRIMKIMELDEENSTALINVHFTCVLSSKNAISLPISSATPEEFDRVKSLVNTTVSELEEMNIQMIDFLSATYCPEEIEGERGLNWPRTAVHQEANSDKYCFKSNGILLKRLCDGDFINGAQWSQTEDCQIADYSSVTGDLLQLWNADGGEDTVDSLCDISSRYEEFNSFDVFLVASITYKHSDEINEQQYVQILDNLFRVDGNILIDAQEQMRSTDYILETMNKVVVVSDNSSDNFITVSVNPQEFSGVVFLQTGIFEIPSDFTLENVTERYQDLEAALWLSPEVRSDIEEEIIFKLFYNSVLFDGLNSESSLDNIFGLKFSDSVVSSSGSIFLLRKMTDTYGDCAFWSYSLDNPDGRGSWKTSPKGEDFSDFFSCEFNNAEASAVTFLIEAPPGGDSVTENLEKLLQSEETPAEIISELALISDRYEEFTPDDVYVVGQILEKISGCTDLDLDALVHVVSNMHKINRTILSESQDEKTATDMILHGVDTIVKNHNYTKSINATSEKFMIFIADVKETDFGGIILYENSKMLQTQNFSSETDIDNLLTHEDFNSALFLPQSLKNQMVDNTKISVTIFSSDGLFNEKETDPKIISKIFGVILPNVFEYLEPLSFIYKISVEGYDRNCVYWSYNKTQNITGLWKKDNEGKNLSSFSKCEFWHTTHFALLLLDKDAYDYDVLEWITNINCGLSMFGLACIILTAVFFKRWRTNSGNQILLNFVFASILQICVFYGSSSLKSDKDYVCTIIGVILHYSIVSQFCWMFVIAVLQFKRFVEVLRGPPRHVLLKACLCGWLLPCLPVACVYFLDTDNYVDGNVGLCYPSGLGLYLGVWLPIAIIVVINFGIFSYIIYSVVHKRTECAADVGNSDVMFQWRLAVLLFFMLGVTWIFGFLSELDFGIVFVYVFCITATLQGFVMFLFFIVFNSNTRYLYAHALKGCCGKGY